MNSPLGSVKPSWDRLCVRVDHPYSLSPLSHDCCKVRTTPSPLFLAGMVGLLKLSSDQGFISTQSLSHVPVISLIGSHQW
jgi:hypothetical protein